MMRVPLVIIQALCLALIGLTAGCALTAGRSKKNASPTGIAYVVRYEGEVPPDTLALIKAVSTAESLRETPPDSVLLLLRRANADKEAFQKVFASQGRFAASVAVSLDETAAPMVLTFRLDPGPQFMLTGLRLLSPDGQPAAGPALPDAAALGLTIPSPFSAKAIVDAGTKLEAFPRHRGYPFATIKDRHVTANFADKEVSVVWTVDLGPKATLGPVAFRGLSSVKASYLAGLVPWQAGETYDSGTLEGYRKKLSALNLFASIQVKPDATVQPDGQVPVVVTVTERKHRTIKGGLNYKTDEGPGANLSWEHRNLFGGGEKLALGAGVSQVSRTGEVTFEKPSFLLPKNTLRAKGRFADEDKEAYTGKSLTGTASLRYKFTEAFSAAAGLGYRATHIDEDKSRPWEDDTRYAFAYVPIEASLDTRDNLLNPQKGVMAKLSLAPYWGTMRTSPNFIRPEATLATYLKLADKPGLVLALRGTVGANLGAESSDISPDLRFYAGGSGSIRGYPYQTVGPLIGHKPLGGDSVATFSAEMRLRVTELIGIVPFLDGGSAFTKALPPYDQPILLAGGLGLRVYTPVGPIRLDVATPLTRRKDIDDIAQFYCSIGQSF